MRTIESSRRSTTTTTTASSIKKNKKSHLSSMILDNKRRLQLIKLRKRLKQAIEEERIDEVRDLLARRRLSTTAAARSSGGVLGLASSSYDEINADLRLVNESINNVIETSSSISDDVVSSSAWHAVHGVIVSNDSSSSFVSSFLKRPASRESLFATKQVTNFNI